MPTVSEMIGVTRVLRGLSVTNVLGNEKLPKEKEYLLRKKYVLRALEILQMELKSKKIFVLE